MHSLTALILLLVVAVLITWALTNFVRRMAPGAPVTGPVRVKRRRTKRQWRN